MSDRGPGLTEPDITGGPAALPEPDAADAGGSHDVGDEPSGDQLCEGLAVQVVRNVGWPAGGSELTLRVLEEDGGGPRLADVSSCLSLTPQLEQAVKRVALPAEHLLLVLSAPADDEDSAALGEAVSDFMADRPEGEKIALLGWSADLEQLAGYTTDRSWLARQAARWFERDQPAPAGALAGLAESLDEMAAVGGDGPRGLRAVVVFGEGASAASADVQLDRGALFVVQPAGDDPAAALAEVDANLRTASEQGFYNLGVCHDEGGDSVVLQPSGQAVGLHKTRKGERGAISVGCDATVIASGARPYTRRIEFEFTDEEWAVYGERKSASSKEDFTLSLRLWPDADAVPAVGHLRGRGSLNCKRRNFTLNLDGPSHHLIPGSATDEFYLISMCLDDRYVSTLLGDGLMARLGVFPPRYRLVELSFGTGSKGVYLLMEKVTESLVEGSVGVESVIRRGTDIDGKKDEAKYGVDGDVQALADYHAFRDAADDRSGAELIAWLEDNLALDDYLRWVAFNTLARNGDYIDEVWFFGVRSQAADGSGARRYGVVGWDTDDLFSACHYSAEFAIEVPEDLAYCTESILDHAIFDDPLVFERYVDHLEVLLLQDVDEAAVDDVATWIRQNLLPYLEDPAIAAGMKELVADVPEATDPAVAIAEVDGALTALQDQLEARRVELLSAVATWRAAQ